MKITMQTVERQVKTFLRQHMRELSHIDVIVGVSRGGLIPAALIATTLDRPLVAVYIDRQDHVYVDRTPWIKNKHVLLVDDIVRTGTTFGKMIRLIAKYRPMSIHSYTIFCLKEARIL